MNLRASLATNFVYSQDVADILELAIFSQKNVILYGPAGHGKSEMSLAACQAIGKEPFVQFCGEGMSEAKLFGGLNFKRLETEKVLEYYPERSFLNHEMVIFEELFDAPSNVLLSLKDTLTAKELRNGAQRFPMKTKTIIGLTNRDPKDFAKMSQAAHALTERFPLKHLVIWKDYNSETYSALFKKVFPVERQRVLMGSESWDALVNLASQEASNGNIVSPRIAVEAFNALMSSAAINKRTQVTVADFAALKFFDCFAHVGKTFEERIMQQAVICTAKTQLSQAATTFTQITNDLQNNKELQKSVIKMLQMIKRLSKLESELNEAKFPDELFDTRDNLVKNIRTVITNWTKYALSQVRA